MLLLVLSICSISFFVSEARAENTMGYIDLHFCEGNTSRLAVTLDTGTTTYDICMKFTNNGAKTTTFRVDIVEGEVAYGSYVTKACATGPSGYFGKNTVLTGDAIVTLKPRATIEKHAIYTVPTGYAGVAH